MTHPLIFVSGKGGVGKSTTSLFLSRENQKAVLAEMTPALADLAARLHVPHPPIYRFSRDDLAKELIIDTLKIETLANLLAKSAIFKTLIDLAPNLQEMLLLKKWMELSETQPVIVDAPATGHFLALFQSIEAALSLFDGGLLRKKIEALHQRFVLGDNVQFVIVATAEHSALEERDELERELKKLYPKVPQRFILNRKHFAPSQDIQLPENLFDIAFTRPDEETKRIAGYHFDNVVPEGATTL